MNTASPHCRSPKVAVVGTGMIGRIHARSALACGAELAGVVGSTPERGIEIAQSWGVEALGTLTDVLADPTIDVVHLCTPNTLHFEQASAVIAAGKHVICEKPLAVTVDDAALLATQAAEAGVVATVPFVYRYHPLVREIRARRIAGEFGDLQLVHGSYLQDWLLAETAYNWRLDHRLGGASRAFADIGSHWCDLVEWVTGLEFELVMSKLQTTQTNRSVSDPVSGVMTRHHIETEDVATVLLQSTRGPLASTVISQVSPGRKNRLWFQLDGSKASAVFDQENPESIWLGAQEESRIFVRDPGVGSAEQRRLSVLPAGHAQGYAQCFDAFVRDTYAAVAGATPEGLPTFEDGLRSARIVDAVLTSNQSEQWTKVYA
ncbi:Gfo/Idh/MocA family protein (plasmid) [Rhodococcus erythropolis]|uniref:Gfo/Idh/MocA family protein n=1 Tax=Rhodococcus erythropolis TaxID=1833 RepID=UPI00406BB45C